MEQNDQSETEVMELYFVLKFYKNLKNYILIPHIYDCRNLVNCYRVNLHIKYILLLKKTILG